MSGLDVRRRGSGDVLKLLEKPPRVTLYLAQRHTGGEGQRFGGEVREEITSHKKPPNSVNELVSSFKDCHLRQRALCSTDMVSSRKGRIVVRLDMAEVGEKLSRKTNAGGG